MSGWDALFAVGAFLGQLLIELARGLWAITKFLGKALVVTVFVLFCATKLGRQTEYRTRPE